MITSIIAITPLVIFVSAEAVNIEGQLGPSQPRSRLVPDPRPFSPFALRLYPVPSLVLLVGHQSHFAPDTVAYSTSVHFLAAYHSSYGDGALQLEKLIDCPSLQPNPISFLITKEVFPAMMNDGFAALRAFASTTPEYYGPQGTISLAEASLLTPTSPESFTQHKEEERKPTKKRKSWGQELPTPKTNLPPRYGDLIIV